MAELTLLTPPDTPKSQYLSTNRSPVVQMPQRHLFFPDPSEGSDSQCKRAVDTYLTSSRTSLLSSPQFDSSREPPKSNMKIFTNGNQFSDLTLECRVADGQWGNVYKARVSGVKSSQHRRNDSGIGMSDFEDTSPFQGIVAVKKASNKSAVTVLQHEANILTHLITASGNDEYVVPFYGYDMQHRAVVMEYIPRTLEDFVFEMENIPNRAEAVESSIRRLSKLLVDGLRFIHEAGVIHGDIKPGNILLRGSRREFMQPLYCDFTASRYNTPDSNPGESAGTYDFMAPELFKSSATESVSSFASDVYGLGVTILYAIIGRSPFEDAANVFMRRAMAMQGTPLLFVSSCLTSLKRLEESGLESMVDGAVRKQPQKRWSSSDWSIKLES